MNVATVGRVFVEMLHCGGSDEALHTVTISAWIMTSEVGLNAVSHTETLKHVAVRFLIIPNNSAI